MSSETLDTLLSIAGAGFQSKQTYTQFASESGSLYSHSSDPGSEHLKAWAPPSGDRTLKRGWKEDTSHSTYAEIDAQIRQSLWKDINLATAIKSSRPLAPISTEIYPTRSRPVTVLSPSRTFADLPADDISTAKYRNDFTFRIDFGVLSMSGDAILKLSRVARGRASGHSSGHVRAELLRRHYVYTEDKDGTVSQATLSQGFDDVERNSKTV